MDVWAPPLERHAGSPVGHVERVGDPHDPGLEGQRLATAAVPDDRVHRLGDDDGPLRFLVDAVEQSAELVGGEEQAVGLVVGAMHRMPVSWSRHAAAITTSASATRIRCAVTIAGWTSCWRRSRNS